MSRPTRPRSEPFAGMGPYLTRLGVAANVARALNETAANYVPTKTYRSAPGGDPLLLRGVPAIGRSVSGAILGTDPEREALRRSPGGDG